MDLIICTLLTYRTIKGKYSILFNLQTYRRIFAHVPDNDNFLVHYMNINLTLQSCRTICMDITSIIDMRYARYELF